MLSPTAQTLKDGIRDDIEKTQIKYAGLAKSIQTDARETVRNLSLASGGLATGALILLGSDFPSIPVLIVLGVVCLLVEVLLVFWYLLRAQNKDGKDFYRKQREELAPSIEVLNLCEDARDGKIPESALFARVAEMAIQQKEKMRNSRDNYQEREEKLDQWDKVFIGALIFGVVLISLGVIIPFVFPSTLGSRDHNFPSANERSAIVTLSCPG